MLLYKLAALVTHILILTLAILTPVRAPHARRRSTLDQLRAHLDHTEIKSPPLHPARDAIKRRQTSRQEIVRRATRRLTVPRAVVSASATNRCGWTGPLYLRRTGTTSHVGQSSATSALRFGSTRALATRLSFDAQCQLVTPGGLTVYAQNGDPAALSDLLLGTEAAIAASPASSSLSRQVTLESRLVCTRVPSSTSGAFCATIAASSNLFYGGTCTAGSPNADFIVVDV